MSHASYTYTYRRRSSTRYRKAGSRTPHRFHVEVAGLTGNTVMTPNITATVHVLPKGSTFSGGKEFAGVWVEWKVPSFTFSNREVQQGFFKDATDIIQELSGGQQPRGNIYVNVVHTINGAWNLDS